MLILFTIMDLDSNFLGYISAETAEEAVDEYTGAMDIDPDTVTAVPADQSPYPHA